MIISFVGHSSVPCKDRVKEMVKKQMRDRIINTPSITCYLGGYGEFDEICACVCRELQQEYVGIEVVYVTPYLSLSQQEKIKEMHRLGLYDSTIYPPIENVPPRFAISKRNEWMIINADVVIAYINHSYGGAYQAFRKAKQKKKTVINICDYL